MEDIDPILAVVTRTVDPAGAEIDICVTGGADDADGLPTEWRSSCAVDISGSDESGLAAATVRVYAVAGSGRTLLGSGTIVTQLDNTTRAQRVVEVKGRGALRFAVTITKGPNPPPANEVTFSVVTYGSEPA